MSAPNPNPVRCLILACGNTLRGDDGVGPWLATWAEEQFSSEPAVGVISRQQWTPDLAKELAHVESVLFVDCAVDAPPGGVRITRVKPERASARLATHHTDAAELLALSNELYGSLPREAVLLTIGAASIEMGETFSQSVSDALAEACDLLERTIRGFLALE